MPVKPYSLVVNAEFLPKVCGKCGRAMVDDSKVVGHDRETGAPIKQIAVRCPKGRNDSGHQAFLVVPVPPAVAQPNS